MDKRSPGGTVNGQSRTQHDLYSSNPATKQRWITVRAVAEMLSTTPRTVYRMIDNGELPGTKFGRSVRIPLDRLEQKEQEAIKENDYGRT